MAGPNNPIEHVQIAPAGQRRASVQGVVKTPEPPHNVPAHRHVGSGPEQAREAWVKRFTLGKGPVDGALESLAKTTALLKEDLGLGLQLERQDEACDAACISIGGGRVEKTVQPTGV